MKPSVLLLLLACLSFCAAASAEIRIMPLGDSITQGDSDHASYRKPLWEMLQAAGHEVDFVGSQKTHHGGPPPAGGYDHDHEGHWGWRIDQVLEPVSDWVDEHAPDIVLVHLGTNDLYQGQPVEQSVTELDALIGEIRAARPEAHIVLAGIIPVDDALIEERIGAPLNPRIEAFNRAVKALAAKRDKEAARVLYIDHYAAVEPEKHTYDGVHPNAAGEEAMAETWFKALEGVLP